ncbi:Outer membrane protein beta-barrel domain-containing protein [Zhouia amylolytica]|uniref:Outer membrane protein beta-barrel domain-containing protein n=1 Tax=Zhouia amylolytica TaxID=376730 RepID=A0A1I6RU17_9FLAO|nr:porin family protein [Zhouia amylolytica]MCQ0111878.1 PorT family protein [Zhouia amylolytica]SFS68207.1 Outer membrane protein beta-barrel domain-containing protein [Zhouia amylolytica]
MKKTLLLFFVLASTTIMAQTNSGWGIKGGLNYNSNGKYFDDAADIYEDPSANVGYHFGFFGKGNLTGSLFIKPELVYTKTKSDYNGDKFDMSKLDMPVLLGYKILGPLEVFAGPAFQYILDTEFDGITMEDVENDFTIGMNIGVGISLGNIGIDLRYDRGFSDNEATFINDNIVDGAVDRVDTRPEQLVLGVSLRL